MKIEAGINNLREILKTEGKFYQIPEYQRPYNWDEDNVTELIDDLVTAYTESKDEKYFCGSLVLAKNENNGRFDVIDGQQRITTFIIVSCVVRDAYDMHLNEEAASHITESIRGRFGNKQDKLILLTGEDYQTKFHETVIQAGRDFNQFPKGGDNRYLENACHIKSTFDDKIKETEITEDGISDFILWLFESVVMTVITCPSEDSAIRIFDVLNSRGLPLTSVDILKAWLMRKLQSKDDRGAFNQTWNNIGKKLEYEEFKMEEMLNTYLYYQKAPNSKERLDKALKDVWKDESNSLGIVDELDDFSKSYCSVLTKREKHSHCLRYLNHAIYWTSILATADFRSYPCISELKSILVAYFYQNWIAGSYVTRIKQTSLNVLKCVKNNDSIEKIKGEMRTNLDKYGTTQKFKEELKGNYVYGRKWDRALLLLIEYFSTDDSKNDFVELSNKLHIEHILPQTPDGEWKDMFTESEIEKWTHSLANLTLLSGRKDSQASNSNFAKKKQIYANADGKASSFVITQNICKYGKWDAQSLEQREAELMEKIMNKLDLFHDI